MRWIDPDIKKQERKERKIIHTKAKEIERKRREMYERIERAKEMEKQRQQENGKSNNDVDNSLHHLNNNDVHIMNVIKIDNNKKRKRIAMANSFGKGVGDNKIRIKTSILEPMEDSIPSETTGSTNDTNNSGSSKTIFYDTVSGKEKTPLLNSSSGNNQTVNNKATVASTNTINYY